MIAYLNQIPQEDYPCQSRVHKVPHLGGNWYIKREDELGFFTGGSKIRKWRTLVPHLVSQGIEDAILIGSAHSNNVLGLGLLLLEKGIKPRPLLLKSHDEVAKGNRLYIELTTEPVYVTRNEWGEVNAIAEGLKGPKTAVIPEGSYLPEAFWGAMTLALDVMRNEREMGISFDHIFVDAGTGLQAMALILGLAWMRHNAEVSVMLISEQEEHFRGELLKWQKMIPEEVVPKFRVFSPQGQRGFRPLSGKGLKNIVAFARKTGVWTDPLYSGRLIAGAPLQGATGNILLIHSGGLSSLSGFAEDLLD